MSVPAPRVYLVDASIYVFRAWHVLPDTIVDAAGEPAHATLGFADFLVGLLERTRATHIGFAFDESLEVSCRNAIYPPYKANREPAPASLRRQFAQCRRLVAAAGIAEHASTTLEADDLLGTLAVAMRAHGLRHTVVTGDKDLVQLVRTGDEWWDFARDVRLDVRGIERRFGVAPHQIPDLLALAGDKIDNIPGVPGVGMATAARLLKRWGDLDRVLANLDGVRVMRFRGAARVARLLAEHGDSARLSRRLTGVRTAAELAGASPEALARRPANEPELEALCDELALGAGRRRRLLDALREPATP